MKAHRYKTLTVELFLFEFLRLVGLRYVNRKREAQINFRIVVAVFRMPKIMLPTLQFFLVSEYAPVGSAKVIPFGIEWDFYFAV